MNLMGDYQPSENLAAGIDKLLEKDQPFWRRTHDRFGKQDTWSKLARQSIYQKNNKEHIFKDLDMKSQRFGQKDFQDFLKDLDLRIQNTDLEGIYKNNPMITFLKTGYVPDIPPTNPKQMRAMCWIYLENIMSSDSDEDFSDKMSSFLETTNCCTKGWAQEVSEAFDMFLWNPKGGDSLEDNMKSCLNIQLAKKRGSLLQASWEKESSKEDPILQGFLATQGKANNVHIVSELERMLYPELNTFNGLLQASALDKYSVQERLSLWLGEKLITSETNTGQALGSGILSILHLVQSSLLSRLLGLQQSELALEIYKNIFNNTYDNYLNFYQHSLVDEIYEAIDHDCKGAAGLMYIPKELAQAWATNKKWFGQDVNDDGDVEFFAEGQYVECNSDGTFSRLTKKGVQNLLIDSEFLSKEYRQPKHRRWGW